MYTLDPTFMGEKQVILLQMHPHLDQQSHRAKVNTESMKATRPHFKLY